MARTKATFLIATGFAASLTAMGANALTLTRGQGVVGLSFRLEAHGCHYSCECGPLKDFGCEQVYHRHLHMLCLPVRCPDKKCDPAPPEGACRHIRGEIISSNKVAQASAADAISDEDVDEECRIVTGLSGGPTNRTQSQGIGRPTRAP